MIEFLNALLAFPTVIYTILLSVVVIYWLFVVIGALDMDFLDVHLDGAGDGVVEGLGGHLDGIDGAVGGHLDGAVAGHLDGIDGALDGADGALDGADGALHGHGHVHADGSVDGGGFSGVLSSLGLRAVPLTVAISFVVLWAWLLTFIGMEALGDLTTSKLGNIAISTGVALGSLFASLFVTRQCVRPLERFFVTHDSPRSGSFVGQVCVVQTQRVDGRFGQAELADGGAGLLLQVRCADTNELTRGSKALIIDYDEEQGIFQVVSFDRMLE